MHYYADPRYLKTKQGKDTYYLVLWRDSERGANSLCDYYSRAVPGYRFIVERIPFMRKDRATVRYGVYAAMESP